MTRVLKIGDGTDEIDFESASSGYTLLYHTPAVAMRDAQSGELYTRVVEELGVSVSGSSRAQIVSRVQLLTELIDRAQRHMRGENVAPVLFEYQVEGSTLAGALKALVTGPPPGEGAVMLPALYDSAFTARQAGSSDDPLVWRFERRGAWLGDEETVTLGNTFEAGELGTHNFSTGGALDLPSPLLYRVSNIPTLTAGAERLPRGIILVNAHDYILIVEAEDEAAGGWTIEDESANFARGGDVARSASASPQIVLNPAGVTGSTGLSISGAYTVFAVMRVSAADTTWGIQMFLSPASGGSQADAGKTRQILFSSTKPTAVCLGTVRSPMNETDGFLLNFNRLTGSGTLDIDYFVITDPTRPEFGVVQLTLDDTNVTSVTARITADHSLLTKPNPRVYIGNTAAETSLGPLPYRGNASLVSQSQELDAVLLWTGEDNSGAYWRYMHNSALYTTLGLSATRRPAYLVPR